MTVIPLNVTLEDGTVLRDGIDMTPSEYYTHLHKLNPRTAALLSAFGWAVGYLLAGKVLAVLLPVPPGGAARFCRVCLLAPLAEEGVFRGAVQRRAQPLGRGQAILLIVSPASQ